MKSSAKIVSSPTRTLQGMKRLKNAKLSLLMTALRELMMNVAQYSILSVQLHRRNMKLRIVL